jgi:CRISPR/Cas system CSM-associated protein Csm3 (group 7 of RAMP superfamily)
MDKVTTYRLTFRTSFSIFTGLGVAGLVDRMVTRDQEGLPCINGSTVKGRWRFFAERLLNSGSLPAELKKTCAEGASQSAAAPQCKQRHSACTLCRLFGNPALEALLQVGQAQLTSEFKESFRCLLKKNNNPVFHPDAEIRPGIALSRQRRIAVPDHLFFDEAIAPVSFQGSLHFADHLEPIPDPRQREREIELLKFSGRLVDGLGARKAKGHGALDGGIVVIGAE